MYNIVNYFFVFVCYFIELDIVGYVCVFMVGLELVWNRGWCVEIVNIFYCILVLV